MFLSCSSPPGTRPETSIGQTALCQIPVQSGRAANARARALEFVSAPAAAQASATSITVSQFRCIIAFSG